MKSDKNVHVANIEFVLQECLRFKKIINTRELKDIPPEDFLYTMKTRDKTKLICGRLATLRLRELAEEIGLRGGLLEKIELKTIQKPLENLIIERFVKEERPLNNMQVDRLFNTVIKLAKSRCIQQTHFIPCHLMTTKDPSIIQLGPVTFHNKSNFRRLLIGKLRSTTKPKGESTNHTRMLFADTLRYFRHFQWVAEVTIPSADSATSTKLAEQAAISALDCLHLLLRAKNTHRMKVGGPAIRHDKRASLTILSNGELSPSASWAAIPQVNFPDGWSDDLLDPYFDSFLKLFSTALELTVDPSLERPISRRFLDAAQWFGEATRDSSPSTKIVKFVTALERMVMTEEHDDISRTVSERVAYFCADELEGFDIWKERTKHIYNLRSRLVHGSISPRTSEINKSLHICASIAERTLLNSLIEFGKDSLKVKKISTRRLGKWFEAKINIVKV